MNLIKSFKEGQKGINIGIPFGKGLENLTSAVGGVQKGRMYGIASPPKVGKSTFVDYAFLLNPYKEYLKNKEKPIEIIYFSFEINRISKEFDLLTYFLNEDYNINRIYLQKNIRKNKKDYIPLSPDFLQGRVLDDNDNLIPVPKNIIELIEKTYNKHIIPLFGEYSKKGIQKKKGLINFIDKKDNPTGIYKFLLEEAAKDGAFVKKHNRIVGYKTKKDIHKIVITDHLRKLIPERGWNMKATVDKYVAYTIDIKNWCNYTFAHIIHTNRNLASADRLRSSKTSLYPTAEDIKETGNLSEDADYILTMFNPNDDRYKLQEHFGLKLKENGKILYPNLRTIHLVESRYGIYPQHFKTKMIGNTKKFEIFNN